MKLLLALYKDVISPVLAALLRGLGVSAQCKFHPSCAEYAVQALAVHGVFHGTLLGGLRVVRCHPFAKGGLDPIPSPKSHSPAVR